LDDTKLLTPPVDVLQPHADNLAGTQSISCQQQHYGIIAKSERSLILVYVLKDPFDLVRPEYLGHILEPVQAHTGNCGGEIPLQIVLVVQEAEEITQTVNNAGARRSPEFGSAPSQESINRGYREFLQFVYTRCIAQPLQEDASCIAVFPDCGLRETAKVYHPRRIIR
jgi:hypothetical protein